MKYELPLYIGSLTTVWGHLHGV